MTTILLSLGFLCAIQDNLQEASHEVEQVVQFLLIIMRVNYLHAVITTYNYSKHFLFGAVRSYLDCRSMAHFCFVVIICMNKQN